MKALFVMGRVLFGGFFLFNGLGHFMQMGFLAQYAGMKGVPAPAAAVAVTGIMLILGGASILLGARPRIGIALIVAFLLPTSVIMHDFWTVPEQMPRAAEMVNFLKNFALAGAALMLTAVPEPWTASLASRGQPSGPRGAGRG